MDFAEECRYNEENNYMDILIQEDIVYQNKDITSKMLAENFKGKSFRVYGLDIPEIKQVLPTNIPTVKAHELRLDNLFALADGTVAIVDYESEYKKTHKVKYLNYLTGIANRYLKEKQDCPIIRMIVIYTGDIERDEVSDTYDIGALNMHIESAFLSELDSEEIYGRLKQKVETHQRLTDEELMEFIILPLSYKKRAEKEEKLDKIVKLATHIADKKHQIFILSGILTFTDKIINMETANRIRRVIELTQVARIFEEEKREAVLQVTKIFEREKEEAVLQVTKIFEREKEEAVLQTAKKLEKEKEEAVSQATKKLEKEKEEAVSQATKKLEKEKEEAVSRATKKLEKEKEEAVEVTSRQIIVKMLQKNYPPEEIASLVTGYSVKEILKIQQEL